MRRKPLWLLLVGSIAVVVGIVFQAFSIAAYIRGAGGGALDMHRVVGDVVHLGELSIVIGAIWRWWGAACVCFLPCVNAPGKGCFWAPWGPVCSCAA